MDSSQRNPEDDAKRETHAGVASCPMCQLAVRVAISLATITLIVGLLVTVVLQITRTETTEAAQANRSPEEELMKRLQQCQTDHRDLNLMLHTVTQDSRCSVCPKRWLWWNGQCYFFSVGLEDGLQWNKSAEFCRRHNSSLAVIKDLAEMEFIQGVMRKFPRFPFLWVGLTDAKEEGRWVWWDGTEIQHYIPVNVEWDAEHRDCADLRGSGSLFAVNCESYGPWICKRAS